MGRASSQKGARAERDASTLLTDTLGLPVRRMLGAGRKDDVGDIDGLVGFTVQVADRGNLGEVLRHKASACELQQINRATPYGMTLMKLPPLPGGRPQAWRVVMTPDQFAQIYRALREHHGWPL